MGVFLLAVLTFRDAYRFSSFTYEQGDHKGMRYQAEVEMEKTSRPGKLGHVYVLEVRSLATAGCSRWATRGLPTEPGSELTPCSPKAVKC